ncbi:MAG: 1-acyl-sn-glycerol-3-phosphate acyltransferase [Cyclobacteriaceae bacterium]|nr:1-acyl-sn-glycerol-3-phosphate acyltransferase [Cyclobacteriaceae bacterium]
MIQKIFYHALKFYCRVVLRFYFREWQVQKQTIIADGPVIFVANHQNAFLDAVLIICSSHRNPWALARANVFKKKWARTLLTFIQMMPVYRFRDGFDTLRKNEAIMEQCAVLLKTGNSILIFGEGNHNEHYNLRHLQKGFVRIAQAALQHLPAIKIVPVGLHYENHTAFRSRVLVSFGKPITITKNYFDLNIVQQTDLLLKTVSDEITPLILSIPESTYEASLQYLQTNRKQQADIIKQLQHEQQLVKSLAVISAKETETCFNNTAGLHKAPEGLSEKVFQKIIRAYYTLNHWPARLIVRSVTGKPNLDPQFIASLKFALGMVTVPLFYFLQIGLVAMIGNLWLTIGYAISLPLSVILLGEGITYFKPKQS